MTLPPLPKEQDRTGIPDTDLQLFFGVLPMPYLMLTPDLRIVGANDAYLRVTMTSRSEIIGQQLFDVFPDNAGDPEGKSETKLRASLERAMRAQGTDVMPILRHDMLSPSGEHSERFWSPTITTIWRPDGELAYITLHIDDVTELVRATHAGTENSEATEQLQARYDETKLQSLAREQMLLDRIAADRERLQAVADAKDEFLDIVSHELRTPITIVRGNAAILLRPATTAVEEDSRRAALTDIAVEADRISTILDNLLILARPELNEAASAEPCSVTRLAERAIADHRRQFPERSLKVEYENKSEVVVDCVETYVGQILQNLLSNAEKYSPPGEPIIVRIQPREGDVRICVLDRGKGFTPEEAAQVFEPFFRIKDERSHRSGLGVGLTVCKRLVEVMGGSIWVTSRPEGGAEVGFLLPLTPIVED